MQSDCCTHSACLAVGKTRLNSEKRKVDLSHCASEQVALYGDRLPSLLPRHWAPLSVPPIDVTQPRPTLRLYSQ